MNELERSAPNIVYEIKQLETRARCTHDEQTLDIDDLKSDSSGNHSETDEINKLQILRK